MTPWQWILLAVLGVAPVVSGMLLGRRKGRPVLGIVLALIHGWFGVIIAAIIPATRAARQQKQ